MKNFPSCDGVATEELEELDEIVKLSDVDVSDGRRLRFIEMIAERDSISYDRAMRLPMF